MKQVSKNIEALSMFANAGEDYISSRCLLLSGFTEQAAVLFCQSVEKAFKAYIFIHTGNKSQSDTNEKKHSPYHLKDELKKNYDHGFDKYNDLLKHISAHWHWRYHDNFHNNKKSKSISPKELEEWDELWLFIFKSIPLDEKDKFRLTFLSSALSVVIRGKFPQFNYWLFLHNKAFSEIAEEMQHKFDSLGIHK